MVRLGDPDQFDINVPQLFLKILISMSQLLSQLLKLGSIPIDGMKLWITITKTVEYSYCFLFYMKIK